MHFALSVLLYLNKLWALNILKISLKVIKGKKKLRYFYLNMNFATETFSYKTLCKMLWNISIHSELH